jgi:AcrR family transcriptional regulator
MSTVGRDRGRKPGRARGAGRGTAAAPAGLGRAFEAGRAGRPRRQLSREEVVGAAVRILRAEGEAALTLRRLAVDLGVGVASLYWWVESREVLMDLALDVVLGDLVAAPAEAVPRGDEPLWVSQVRSIAEQMYAQFRVHPWAANQMLRSADRGPNTLRGWERISAVYAAGGFAPRQSFLAMSTVLTFVLGMAVQEAINREGVSDDELEVRREEALRESGEFLSNLDPEEFPHLREIGPVFATHVQQEQFDAGLEAILVGLQHLPKE